jgi:NTE family protein
MIRPVTEPRRALVLGGGGITGIAWEIGMIAGLRDAGLNLQAADVVVGTSAGSVVGALLLSGATVEELYASQLEETDPGVGGRLGLGVVLRYVLASVAARSAQEARARLGRRALTASRVPESERREIIERHVAVGEWPARRLLITAVEAETGEFKIFDRDSGVSITDAVAASCAVPLVWPPVSIGGRRYMDGGVRSIANADLAAGCDRVVVLAPVTVSLRRSGRISLQLERLGAGVRSTVVSPDRAARRAIGRQVLDPARRGPAARAGREQAAVVAEEVRAVWEAA